MMKRVIVVLLLAAAVASCERRQETTKTAPTPAPTPAPLLGEITGSVTLQGESDHSGTLIFLGGTQHGAYTDIEGHFRIAGVEPGVYGVTAQQIGFQKKRLDEVTIDETANGGKPIELLAAELTREPVARHIVERTLGSISGFARYADRSTHAGILIRVVGGEFSSVTDAAGGFKLHNLEPGSYAVTITADGYQPETVNAIIQPGGLTTIPAVGTEHAIFLTPLPATSTGRRVVGRVELFNADGIPVERYDETLVALEGTGYVAALDEAGKFVINDIAPGFYGVVAIAPGYALAEKRIIDLRNQLEANVLLSLYEMPPAGDDIGDVVGQITLEEGGSPVGAQVGLAGTGYVALAGESGQFEITGAPEGVYTLVAFMEGYVQAEVRDVAVVSAEVTNVGAVSLKKAVTAPTVLVTEPYDGEMDVPVERVVPALIRFSEKMDPRSTLASISVSPAVEYYAYLGRRHPMSDYDLLYLEFAGIGEQALRFGEVYEVTIDSTARDVYGVAMEAPYSFAFATGQAQVIDTYPRDGDGGVVLSRMSNPVRIFFNARIDPETLDQRSIRVTPDMKQRPDLYTRVDLETGWSTVYLRMDWRPGVKYTVSVSNTLRLEGSRQKIESLPYQFSFTTDTSTPAGELIGRGRR